MFIMRILIETINIIISNIKALLSCQIFSGVLRFFCGIIICEL